MFYEVKRIGNLWGIVLVSKNRAVLKLETRAMADKQAGRMNRQAQDRGYANPPG